MGRIKEALRLLGLGPLTLLVSTLFWIFFAAAIIFYSK